MKTGVSLIPPSVVKRLGSAAPLVAAQQQISTTVQQLMGLLYRMLDKALDETATIKHVHLSPALGVDTGQFCDRGTDHFGCHGVG